MKRLQTSMMTILTCALLAACDQGSPAPAPSVPAPGAPAAVSTPASKPSAPTAGSTSPTQSHPEAEARSTLEVMGLMFPLPEGWRSAPPSNSMRLAEVLVADPSGDSSKGCVVAFSTAGGTVESNIARWAGQVAGVDGKPATAQTKSSTVAGLKVSTVELVGTYAGMGDSSPRPNWMLRGSIVETDKGLLFIKMTGPADAMKAASVGYDSMVRGIAKK